LHRFPDTGNIPGHLWLSRVITPPYRFQTSAAAVLPILIASRTLGINLGYTEVSLSLLADCCGSDVPHLILTRILALCLYPAGRGVPVMPLSVLAPAGVTYLRY
jgi:hypothetical protein